MQELNDKFKGEENDPNENDPKRAQFRRACLVISGAEGVGLAPLIRANHITGKAHLYNIAFVAQLLNRRPRIHRESLHLDASIKMQVGTPYLGRMTGSGSRQDCAVCRGRVDERACWEWIWSINYLPTLLSPCCRVFYRSFSTGEQCPVDCIHTEEELRSVLHSNLTSLLLRSWSPPPCSLDVTSPFTSPPGPPQSWFRMVRAMHRTNPILEERRVAAEKISRACGRWMLLRNRQRAATTMQALWRGKEGRGVASRRR